MITLTCPGSRNPLMGVSPRSRSARSGSGMVLCRLRRLKLARPAARASSRAAAVVGAVVSKPMPAKTTCRSGSSAAIAHRVARRVDDAHVGAGGALRGQRAARRRHADQVAERDQRHLGQPREREHAVEVGHRRDADRAARPADEADAVGQQLAQPVAGDGHGVGAADLHEREAGPRLVTQLGGEPAEVVGGGHRGSGSSPPWTASPGAASPSASSPSSKAPISRRRS